MDLTDVLVDAVRAAIGIQAIVYALAAIGLNIHFGYTGLLNFGQSGFMLLGAYGVAVTVSTYDGPFWLGVLVSMVLAVIFALLLGIPTLHLRTDYLAITTIAAAEILRLAFRSTPMRPVTNGVFGLQQFAGAFYDANPIPKGSYGIGGVSFSERELWVNVVGWLLVAVASLLVLRLMRSPWGRVLQSIREDEDATRSLGKYTFAYKLQSLALGGVIGALAGVMLAINQQAVNPDTFQPAITFFAYTALILGGVRRVAGPIIGSVLFWFVVSGLDSLLREAIDAGVIPDRVLSDEDVGIVRLMLVGLGLMLLIVFRPQGLLGDRREAIIGGR